MLRRLLFASETLNSVTFLISRSARVLSDLLWLDQMTQEAPAKKKKKKRSGGGVIVGSKVVLGVLIFFSLS